MSAEKTEARKPNLTIKMPDQPPAFTMGPGDERNIGPSPLPESEAVAYRYVGKNNETYAGVPARNLTKDEFIRLSPEAQFQVTNGHVTGVKGDKTVVGKLFTSGGGKTAKRTARKARRSAPAKEEQAKVEEKA